MNSLPLKLSWLAQLNLSLAQLSPSLLLEQKLYFIKLKYHYKNSTFISLLKLSTVLLNAHYCNCLQDEEAILGPLGPPAPRIGNTLDLLGMKLWCKPLMVIDTTLLRYMWYLTKLTNINENVRWQKKKSEQLSNMLFMYINVIQPLSL